MSKAKARHFAPLSEATYRPNISYHVMFFIECNKSTILRSHATPENYFSTRKSLVTIFFLYFRRFTLPFLQCFVCNPAWCYDIVAPTLAASYAFFCLKNTKFVEV